MTIEDPTHVLCTWQDHGFNPNQLTDGVSVLQCPVSSLSKVAREPLRKQTNP